MKNYMEVIENVAKLMEKYDLQSVSYNENASSIHLMKTTEYPHFAMPGFGAAMGTANVSTVDASAVQTTESQSLNAGNEVKAPMVGVFFSAPTPDDKPFVSIGDSVKKGDVLCILEAMKLMNEIQAEQDGVITNIFPKNGDVVEFGQVLFTIA